MIEKLTAIAGDELAPRPPSLTVPARYVDARLVREWRRLLEARNGFYCFESALHVFPSRSWKGNVGLDEWNSPNLWRGEYGGLEEEMFFIAEDIFGCQFGLSGELICTFDPETAETRHFCHSVSEWAERILGDFNTLTGYSLAHEWQLRFGPLPIGRRLVPKIPFVLGGEYSVENLYACSAVEGMKVRANLARQLVDVPEGGKIEYKVVP